MKARLTLLSLAAVLGAALVLAQQPYYGSGYGTATLPVYAGGIAAAEPQPPPAAEPPWVGRLESKLDELARLLKDRPAVGEGPPPARAEAKGGPEDALVSAAGACATCHAPDVAKQDGGDFTFFQAADGGLDMIAPATLNEWRTLQRQVASGKMPPPNNKRNVPPLTGEQKAAMVKWLAENQPKK